jgi:hypothetical protein
MNTEERLRSHLERATAGLPDVDRLDTIVAEGGRRRIRTRIGAVLATAAAVAAVVMAGQSLQPGTGQAPVLSQPSATSVPRPGETTLPPVTTTAPVAPGSAVRGVLIADTNGIRAVGADGETELMLTSDEGYSKIAVAFEDRRGGIIFQHAATPLPWPQGSLLRLEAGTTVPTLLFSPPAGGRVVPVGPAGTEGDAKFVFLVDTPTGDNLETEIAVIDLDTGEISGLGFLESSMDMSVGGELISIVDRGGDCPTHLLRTLDGGEIPSPLPDCLPLAAGVTAAGNGSALGMLNQGEFTVWTVDAGEELRPATLPGAYMVTGAVGGWVFRTPTATVILDYEGNQTSIEPVDTGWVSPYSTPLEIAPGATLGSGSGEMPCTPSDAPLADQDLPAPVAETRAAIHAAASACDYETLGGMALTDATVFTYGGGTDPVAHWIAEGTTGDDPLGLMVQLLSTTPAEDPETGTWAWPAVHLVPDDEASRTELEQVVDAAVMAALRRNDGYLGLRLGITADGTWQFAVAGD